MWRWSGRGWTVMPWAPALSAISAMRTTLGMVPTRELRRVATLLTLTLSFVTRDLRNQFDGASDLAYRDDAKVFLCVGLVKADFFGDEGDGARRGDAGWAKNVAGVAIEAAGDVDGEDG